MSKKPSEAGSRPQLLKYLKLYTKKPSSEAFAPLAESYRLLGMHKEAFSLLEKHLPKFPDYIPGIICLAKCFRDQEDYQKAVQKLRPFLSTNSQNLALLKIYAECLIALSLFDEVKEIVEKIKFLSPKDPLVLKYLKKNINNEVQKIEQVTKENKKETKDILDSLDGWTVKDFSQNELEIDKPISQEEIIESNDKIDESEEEVVEFSSKEETQNFELEEETNTTFSMDEVGVDQDNQDLIYINEETPKRQAKESSPMITFTLVELYMSQGYFKKALEVLYKFKELGNDDKKIDEKIEEIQLKMVENVSSNEDLDAILESEESSGEEENYFNFSDEDTEEKENEIIENELVNEEVSETNSTNEGHDQLMAVFDKKVISKTIEKSKDKKVNKEQDLEKYMSNFLNELKKFAKDKTHSNQSP